MYLNIFPNLNPLTISVSTARSTSTCSSAFKAIAPYQNLSKSWCLWYYDSLSSTSVIIFILRNPYIWICFNLNHLNPLSFHLLQILCAIRSLQQLSKIFRLQLPSAGAAPRSATARGPRGLPGGWKEGERCKAPSNKQQAKANLGGSGCVST